MRRTIFSILAGITAVSACIDPIPLDGDYQQPEPVALEEVAGLLSALPMDIRHLNEVYDAVTSSTSNGYDEEYTMFNLFSEPGSGVGDNLLPAKSAGQKVYENPLSELIKSHLSLKAKVKSSDCKNADATDAVTDYIDRLASSDVQIYWYESESWDGSTFPVITFDPENESSSNVGYKISVGDDGDREVEEVVVDEEFAKKNPVWVVNRNSDDKYMSLEVLRKLNPGDLIGGGGIEMKSGLCGGDAKNGVLAGDAKNGARTVDAKTAGDDKIKSLVIKDFTMNRHYDSWFAGASEFFVKCGSVEDFRASTEAELKLYSPSVTDFMIVVKRDQVGVKRPFNAILFADWTDQVDNCAFMITEDDGGTFTSWKCSAVVKVESKSYGFEVDLPFRTRDDIVWRGSLSRRYFMQNNNVTGHFGDVDITFEILSDTKTCL